MRGLVGRDLVLVLEGAVDVVEPLQKALALDTTPGGVKSLKSVVRSAKTNVDGVISSINVALKEMDRVEKALSSQAGG